MVITNPKRPAMAVLSASRLPPPMAATQICCADAPPALAPLPKIRAALALPAVPQLAMVAQGRLAVSPRADDAFNGACPKWWRPCANPWRNELSRRRRRWSGGSVGGASARARAHVSPGVTVGGHSNHTFPPRM